MITDIPSIDPNNWPDQPRVVEILTEEYTDTEWISRVKFNKRERIEKNEREKIY